MPPEGAHQYFRLQTIALLAVWVVLMFLEWGKPHVVGSSFNPQWVLLGVIFSAIITALLAGREAVFPPVPYRRTAALTAGVITLIGVGAAVSSPVGWLAGVIVWAGILAAFPVDSGPR
ncbi:MAG: hypothetical protein PHI63_06895 [Patescibacteria group bacterium]|nr:hypothetical protein [Patescibacteria group bacterium]